MTKKEIYEQVVRLTAELAQTKVAKNIFSAAAKGDAVKAQSIIDTFPVYYPELNKKIVSFAEEFNKLVGDTPEDDEERREILKNCEILMYCLAETKIISQIAKATETGDALKIQEVINTFREENSSLAENLINFQEEYNQYYYNLHTGLEGSIFGTEVDEENGVFIFDPNIIDASSFCALIIFGKISDVYFFCDEDGELTSADRFFDAIQDATNENFAEFVASYNLVDWVGEGEDYATVGELLVDAFAGNFE